MLRSLRCTLLRGLTLLVATGLATTAFLAAAQEAPAHEAATVRTPEADRAISLARILIDEAIAAEAPAFPDHPRWSKAIVAARTAADRAPDDATAMGLVAEAYSRSGFPGPAWQAWTAYRQAGHVLEPEQMPLFLEVGEHLGYAAYQRGELRRAIEIYDAILDAVPFSKESRVWIARIHMEQGRPADAVPYWETVLAQDPEDDRARYFLGLAEDQAAWGIDAANAFREGVAHYEAGETDDARRAFERATNRNPAYGEAWAWRGRIAFEAESWLVARQHYARAAELVPAVDAYRYFRDEAQRRWDAEAAAAAAAAAEAAAEAAEAAEAEAAQGDAAEEAEGDGPGDGETP